MKKEFLNKVLREGVVDTKNYRYVCRYDGIYRIKLEHLNTTAAYTEWEKVAWN